MTDKYTDELKTLCAEAYQVIGVLADDCGRFGDPKTIHILDNLSAQKLVHADVLPYPSASQPAAEADEREAFEQWAKKEGLIQESFGVRSVNSMCDVAKLAWQARAALAQSQVSLAVKDAERFRLAIAYEDNAGLLYTATINHGGDVDAIRREFDEEAIDFAALKQEKRESP